MKKIVITFLIALPVAGSAQSLHYEIKGKCGDLNAPAMIYLSYDKVLDSAMLKNGVFHFAGNVPDITHAILLLDHNGEGLVSLRNRPFEDYAWLYLEKATIILDSKDSIGNMVITGAPINRAYDRYQKYLEVPDHKLQAISAEFGAASQEKQKDSAFINGLRKRYDAANNEKRALQKRYIQQNPGSFISLQALGDLAGNNMNTVEIEPIYKSLSPTLRNSAAGRGFAERINTARITTIGKMAPGFTQNDAHDKPVSLADFRGRYVLIDFWASWCHPCRAENPNVVKAYNQYKNKNFTILGVSLDNAKSKDAWLAAIREDSLSWTQVCDLKGGDNEVARLYGVSAIPRNFLVDPGGKIVASDLRGEALQEKLEQLLAK